MLTAAQQTTDVTQSAFFGLMSKAKNILRWSLMSQFSQEKLDSHIYEVSVIGHLLGAIACDVFGEDVNPDYVASVAIFHEGGEVAGLADVNSLAKYHNPDIAKAMKTLESFFENKLLSSLPEALQDRYQPLIMQDRKDRHVQLAKFADILSAHNKCVFEVSKSNPEFAQALAEKTALINKLCNEDPVMNYYCEHFLTLSNASFDTQTHAVRDCNAADLLAIGEAR
ncbi:5'-deoxynucleotidase [Alteromonas macleodii]|uniref:HD containing hydrolase-like enzyme family protein n=1 Tax=Alteromonas macleodii TaxID=28108 RepID=A0AB36FMM1_ALTMA|nr:5'-deoxynucleotidase [Alteromonas macleodii]OES24472.1 HD containing hydrolase-like enzyme family protein [Alteromonas macleodii]OES25529.1 HD containing hydrolase-like enzyme family protein [Alteromonas macleodii]OES25830.1 HD containing hydrolase-like enzyme family protein [Alteromonas macleodii]OES38648.1 HD containing hydrolase-like enzyme family protein [Alteromonas macleodii]